MSPRTLIDFDIDRYLRNSTRLDLSGLDWAAVPDHPLTDGDVMCLHYMMDIETHTVIYLRDLLATRAAHDPYVTGFLSCWVYEELWHGEAFSDFLRAYGIEVPAEPKLPDGTTPLPTRPNRVSRFREQMGVGHQLSLLPTLLGSIVMRDFVALHMTWGAINELTTLTGYHQLIRRSRHPVLHQMLQRVIQDERRHSPSTARRQKRGSRPTSARRGSCGGRCGRSGRRSELASSPKRRSTRSGSTCSATRPRGARPRVRSTPRSRRSPGSSASR